MEDLKNVQRIRALEQLVANIVERENGYGRLQKKEPPVKQENCVANGNVRRPLTGQSGTVLTLFGNAPTPKQLFSSMQNRLPGEKESIAKVELPVEELGLPNGLTATKIMPVETDESTTQRRTFSDVFAPPYSLPQLLPPKVHKRSSTRDNKIVWDFKDPISRGSRKGSYTVQSLTVGDWVNYGRLDAAQEPSSPAAKRKQRDRALSTSELQPPPTKVTLAKELESKEEALFRAAYSSFAPTRDNTKALVSEETKNMVWWQKVGHRRFNEVFAIDPALLATGSSTETDAFPGAETGETAVSDDDLARAVQEYNADSKEPSSETARSKVEVEHVLQEISELLETLASHQRNRNATLPSAAAPSKTPISPGPQLVSKLGRPTTPSEDEMTTYDTLRHEIAYLVMKLPPYAVAKLDGDQLADLGVSRLVTFETRSTKGTMEEDQVARMAKYTAQITAAGIASLTRPSSSANQHYSSTQARTPAIGQAANTRQAQPPSYYGSAARPPAPSFNRSTSSQSQVYSTPGAPPRPNYTQTGTNAAQYTRPPSQQSYSQTNGQQLYPPRPNQPSSYGYNHQYQATPQTQPQQRPTYTSSSSSQPLAQFQNRAAQNATAYQTGAAQSPYNRTASPAKPPAYTQPRPVQANGQQYNQQQPSSGRATPSFPSQPQTPNGYMPAAPQMSSQQRAVGLPRGSSGTPQPPAQMNGHAVRVAEDEAKSLGN